MNYKNYIQTLGFRAKENARDIFVKKYADGYVIEIDLEKENINYGDKIICESKTTSNFSQPENLVVLECVNRLLEKGYNPEDIILELTWKLGRQEKGRLDILVKKEGKAFLMIECKTFGKEFDDELKKMKKDGGQLFSYFQQDKNAEILMLYTSNINEGKNDSLSEIVFIKDEYRLAPTVKDFYTIWDKNTAQNGVWESEPYNFQNKKFTKLELKELNNEVSAKIFHEFASILRRHSVSDKPNAFNVIFNLFLAKLYDEAKKENTELDFKYIPTEEPVDFQIKLYNLYQNGLKAFLEKQIEGITDKDFEGAKTKEELISKKKKFFKFNNILAIKEVIDDESFDLNQRVLKEVVKLLENYQIRYPRKQQYLSNFFEKLLTTGLKQEVGQYFTPPPITKFIVRSLPLKQIIEREVDQEDPKLPAVIDYAAGSGHFITEAMEEFQDIINSFSEDKINTFFPKAQRQIRAWQADPYEWAAKYVYGIEKDYRLAKVAKVGCYFYGDGVAQIVHGDGLDSFKTSKTYKGLLKENTNLEDSTKAKFSLVLSNPPYAVNDCKDDLEYIGAQNEFTLYPYLTDKSKDIECLFVERTKHLLKDDGIAAVILPSSILNNTGIQTKTRAIILQNFDIIAIAELGSNTFMATGTNTVTLFLKRKNNQVSIKLKKYVDNFFTDFIDNTIYQIEKPISKYLNYVWENISFEDYVSLLKKEPTQTIKDKDIYKDYRKNIKAKKESEFWDKLLEIEKDKILYFLLAYNQKNIVLVKAGEKNAEKRFLGYYFSDRRGSEGIHAIQAGKTIDECTQLYNINNENDPTKASSYIYNAFLGKTNLEIDEKLKDNIAYADLLDMMTFDRAEFEKTIVLSAKKKVKIESKWSFCAIGDILFEQPKSKIQVGTAKEIKNGSFPFYTSGESVLTYDETLVEGKNIYLSTGGNAIVKFYDGKAAYSTDTYVVCSNDDEKAKTKYIFYFLESIISIINEFYFKGVGLKHLQKPDFRNIKIPLPPIDIQEKIVSEIEVLEEKEKKAKEEVEQLKIEKNIIIENSFSINKFTEISNIAKVLGGKRIPKGLSFSLSKTDFPYIRVSDFKNGTIDLNSLKYIEEDVFQQIKNYTISKEDVYISIAGTIGLVGLIPDILDGKSLTENAAKIVVEKKEKISKEFLFYCLTSENLQKQIEDNTRAVGVPKLALKRIETFKIPLPPLSEQQKIVAEIEKIEEKIKDLEAQVAEIFKQKQAILKKHLH